MMSIAIISDIHSNLEALNAVLKDIRQQNVDRIFCLGDIVGYGPNPNECVDLIRNNCEVVIAGNHDYAALGRINIANFNPYAKAATVWTAKKLSLDSRQFLSDQPLKSTAPGYQLVHSSPEGPLAWSYVLSFADASRAFLTMVEPVCFIGHSHQPLVISKNSVGRFDIPTSSEVSLHPQRHYIVNVGSVGQPRDRNNKSCYLIFSPEDHKISFRRVIYDYKLTQQKIIANELPSYLADRLSKGQ